jgi:rare lipoprotein A
MVRGVVHEWGIASFYGEAFHGKPTASGEPFDMHALTAAHKTLPLGTTVRATNLDNGMNVVVRINDRGPFIAGRIIDLSYGAAQAVHMVEAGIANIAIEILEPSEEAER